MRHLSIKLLIFAFLVSVATSQAAFAGGKGLVFEWVKEGFSDPLAAVSGDGSVFIADGQLLLRLSSAGVQLWSVKLGGEVKSLEADAKGGCWAAFDNRVARVLPTGKVSWTYSCDEEVRCLEPLPDGRVLVGTKLGGLLLDEAGRFVWLYDPATGCDT